MAYRRQRSRDRYYFQMLLTSQECLKWAMFALGGYGMLAIADTFRALYIGPKVYFTTGLAGVAGWTLLSISLSVAGLFAVQVAFSAYKVWQLRPPPVVVMDPASPLPLKPPPRGDRGHYLW